MSAPTAALGAPVVHLALDEIVHSWAERVASRPDAFLAASKHLRVKYDDSVQDYETICEVQSALSALLADHLTHLLCVEAPPSCQNVGWTSLFALLVRESFLRRGFSVGPCLAVLDPARILLYADISMFIIPSLGNGTSPSQVLSHLLDALPGSTLERIILFAYNTIDMCFIEAYTFAVEHFLGKQRAPRLDSFRQHTVVQALFSRLLSLKGFQFLRPENIFDSRSTRREVYVGPFVCVSPQSAPLQRPGIDSRREQVLFFDLLHSVDSSMRLFAFLTKSDEVLDRILKRLIESDSKDNEDTFVNYLIEFDQVQLSQQPPAPSASCLCIIDRTIASLDRLLVEMKRKLRSKFGTDLFANAPEHDSLEASQKVSIHTKFLRNRSLRRRVLDAAWAHLSERSRELSDPKIQARLLFAPEDDGKSSSFYRHSHLCDDLQMKILTGSPDFAAFEISVRAISFSRLLEFAHCVASLGGMNQSSITTVDFDQVNSILEIPEPPSSSPMISWVFFVLRVLQHRNKLTNVVPEQFPGLLLFATEALKLASAMRQKQQRGAIPFYADKLSVIQSIVSSPLGFDLVCEGPIWHSLQTEPCKRDGNGSGGKRVPRDSKAFTLLWVWLKSEATEAISNIQNLLLRDISYAFSEIRHADAQSDELLVEQLLHVLDELYATATSKSQHLWAMCSCFDILELLLCHSGSALALSLDGLIAVVSRLIKSFDYLFKTLQDRVKEGKSACDSPVATHITHVITTLTLCAHQMQPDARKHFSKLIFETFSVFVATLSTPDFKDQLAPALATPLNLALKFCRQILRGVFAPTISESLESVDMGLNITTFFAIYGEDQLIPFLISMIALTNSVDELSAFLNEIAMILHASQYQLLSMSFESSSNQLTQLTLELSNRFPTNYSDSAQNNFAVFPIDGGDVTLTLAIYKVFHAFIWDSKSHEFLLMNQHFWQRFLSILKNPNLAERHPVRKEAFALLRALLVTGIKEDSRWDAIWSAVSNRNLISHVIIGQGFRQCLDGRAENAAAFLDSAVICLEILQALVIRNKNGALDAIFNPERLPVEQSLLYRINTCNCPNTSEFLAGLVSADAMKRLLYLVKTGLDPPAIHFDRQRPAHHRPVTQLLSNILSLPVEKTKPVIIQMTASILVKCLENPALLFLLKNMFKLDLTATRLLETPTLVLPPTVKKDLGSIVETISKA